LLMGGLLVVALALGMRFWPRAGQAAAQATAPQAAAAPPVALPASAPVLATTPLEDADALLPQLPTNIAAAWRVLGRSWALDAAAQDPCQAASAQQLQCYRGVALTLPLVRQLGRPGILTLQKAGAAPGYAVLTGLNDQAATLRWNGAVHRVTLISLARLWHGEFSTFWAPPPGYVADLREGVANGALGRLSQQLSQLEGHPASASEPAAQAMDAALRERVKAFQQGQGLTPDGFAGPMTFMQIDKALGGKGPSLETGAQ
jgi:general secretion pathway protein A